MTKKVVNHTSVTQRIEFECGVIFDRKYESHRYKLEMTVTGPQRFQDNGISIKFAELKTLMRSVVPEFRIIYSSKDDLGVRVGALLTEVGIPVQSYSFSVSAENLCDYFVTSVQSELDKHFPGVVIISARLRENSESFVEWQRTR